MSINKTLTLDKLTELSGDDLRWLIISATAEREYRKLVHLTRKRFEREGWQGLCNFMAGVTWAMACRASLRESKGHNPVGKGLASGEMWFPWEMLYAARHEAKMRGWSPLSQQQASAVVTKLLTEAQRKTPPKEAIAVQFQVRMAEGGANVIRPSLAYDFPFKGL